MIAFCTDIYAADHADRFPSELRVDVEQTFSNEASYKSVFSQLEPSFKCASKYFEEFVACAKELVIPRKLLSCETVALKPEYKSLIMRVEDEKARQT